MELELFTDACGGEKGGFGIFFSGQWAYGKWPDNWVVEGITRDMTLLELFPVVVALTIWSDKLRNQWVHFHVDNQAVVQVINSQTCKSDRVMNLVRHMVLTLLVNNIRIKATYVSSKDNIIADSISRSQWGRFRKAAPEASIAPVKVPPLLWKI